MAKEKSKTFVLKVTKSMCRKVFPLVKPGDQIQVSFKDELRDGSLALVSHNEKQWIEKYSKKLDKYNVYSIVKVIMMN